MNSREYGHNVFYALDNERRKQGMTIREFTSRCGISERTWEGYKENPERMNLRVIHKAANVMMMPMWEVMQGRRGI